MLPWYADMEDWSDEEIDAWYTSLPYNYNGWLNREPVVDQIDFYHEKHGEKNLARVIYELCRCVVPVDLHPFETDREQLVAEGMDEAKARKITETADLLFLANHQACLWKKPDYSWLLEDEAGEDTDEESDSEGKGRSGSPRDGVSNTNYGTESENFPEQDGPDLAEENESLRGELSSLKSQLKSLKSVLAQTKQESNNERAKYEHELKSLRMEHRELADLRELVFNRESDQPERLEKVQRQYSYPYETRKRTVVFGGHDSFLRAFRPMFTNVRFVDAGNMAYSPDIIRNADVVWIQNNCISHPQYWSIVKNCKQAGVQLRYFGFASAEKCAEQLVTEDQKG
ncbi:MAG: hypothetical protein IJ088_09860, partial [Clostridia bacterium]|nr:hypothetical protein [Clostridia bacterium]